MTGSSEIYYTCPGCHRRLASPMRCAGKVGSCPKCGHPIMVPIRTDRFAFLCACGKKLYTKEGLAGKTVRCPACSALIRIPSPADRDRSDSDLARPKEAPRNLPTAEAVELVSPALNQAETVQMPATEQVPAVAGESEAPDVQEEEEDLGLDWDDLSAFEVMGEDDSKPAWDKS